MYDLFLKPKPAKINHMTLHIEYDRETDGRWIADIPELPGVMAYGATKEEARQSAETLAKQIMAEQNSKAEISFVS